MSPDNEKRRVQPAAAVFVVVGLLVAGVAGVPAWGRKPPTATPRPTVTAASRAAWLRVASDLADTVPAAVLLGRPEAHPELDERLGADDLDREVFRCTAVTIREEWACACDEAEEEALATSLGRVSVPEGFAMRRPSEQPQQDREPSSSEAHDLVTRLMARLSKPNHFDHP